MPRIHSFFILSLVFFSPVTFANDSSWGEDNGYITLLKQSDISMAKERLLIAPDRINVDYLFINHSDKDITVPITFPMPPIYQYGGQDIAPGIMNFKLSVEGKPVKTQAKWVVMLFDENGKDREDITEKVIQTGWTIPQLIKRLNEELYNDNGTEKLPPLPAEWFKENLPQFYVQQHFTWQQTFPAGKEIMINHAYTPSLSGGVPTPIEYITGDGSKDNPADECLNATTLKQIKKLDNDVKNKNKENYGGLGWNQLKYILTTGANWKDGVIGDFTLRIHKNSPEDVVVTCFKHPFRQIEPTTLEFKQKNFKPDEDLSFTYYYDSSKR